VRDTRNFDRIEVWLGILVAERTKLTGLDHSQDGAAAAME
jgi:hypothetical protein